MIEAYAAQETYSGMGRSGNRQDAGAIELARYGRAEKVGEAKEIGELERCGVLDWGGAGHWRIRSGLSEVRAAWIGRVRGRGWRGGGRGC